MRFAIGLALVCVVCGCKKNSGASGATAGKPAPGFAPLLVPANLPEPLRFVRFGDSTQSNIAAYFAHPRFRSVGTFGDAEGDKQSMNLGYDWFQDSNFFIATDATLEPQGVFPGISGVGFVFGKLPGRPEPVLVRLTLDWAGNGPKPCDTIRGLITTVGPGKCPDEDGAGPRVGKSVACLGDEEGYAPLAVWCQGDSAVYELIVKKLGSALPAPAPLPQAPAVVVAPIAPPSGTLPPNSLGFVQAEDGALRCAWGTYTLTHVDLKTTHQDGTPFVPTVRASGACDLTISDSSVDGATQPAVSATDHAKVTLQKTTLSGAGSNFSPTLEAFEQSQIVIDGGKVAARSVALSASNHAEVKISNATITGQAVHVQDAKITDGGGNQGLKLP